MTSRSRWRSLRRLWRTHKMAAENDVYGTAVATFAGNRRTTGPVRQLTQWTSSSSTLSSVTSCRRRPSTATGASGRAARSTAYSRSLARGSSVTLSSTSRSGPFRAFSTAARSDSAPRPCESDTCTLISTRDKLPPLQQQQHSPMLTGLLARPCLLWQRTPLPRPLVITQRPLWALV